MCGGGAGDFAGFQLDSEPVFEPGGVAGYGGDRVVVAAVTEPVFQADAIVHADDYSGNLLRPYPPFGNLNAVVPDGYSRYQSMRLRAERRMIGRMR